MKSKHPTVTIGIPAHNEGGNIAHLLRSLTTQSQKRISIEKIIVISDGSEDNTLSEAKSIQDKRIKIIGDSKKRGKNYRDNQFFSISKSDILVIFDSDIIPVNKKTVENLCLPFIKNPNTALTGGEEIGLKPRTLIESSLVQLNDAYNIMRKRLRHGVNIYCIRGSIYALSKAFYSNIKLPLNIQLDDNYLYLLAKVKKMTVSYAANAKVWYRLPQTVHDQILQGTRFLASSTLLKRKFDPHLVDHEFAIPFPLRVHIFFYQIIHNPLAYLYLKCISWYCVIQSHFYVQTLSEYWTVVASSKDLFS